MHLFWAIAIIAVILTGAFIRFAFVRDIRRVFRFPRQFRNLSRIMGAVIKIRQPDRTDERIGTNGGNRGAAAPETASSPKDRFNDLSERVRKLEIANRQKDEIIEILETRIKRLERVLQQAKGRDAFQRSIGSEEAVGFAAMPEEEATRLPMPSALDLNLNNDIENRDESEFDAPRAIADFAPQDDSDAAWMRIKKQATSGDERDQSNAKLLLDWITWLRQKSETLEALEGDELASKVRLWCRRLDSYLWSDPREEIRRADPSEESEWRIENLTAPLKDISDEQERMRAYLRSRKIERIAPSPGAPFERGVTEPSGLAPEPTASKELDNRVYRVEPGEGGYRYGSRVLMPSLARRYQFKSD